MTGTLPNWIQRLLGIEAGAGEGAVWGIEHAWPWAPWVTLLLIVATVLFVIMIYARENRQAGRLVRTILAATRLALIGIVLAMIAQYMLSLQRTGLPYVAVLLDDSLSMSIVDPYEESLRTTLEKRLDGVGLAELSRANLAKTLLTERDSALLRRLARDYKLRLYFTTTASSSHADNVAGITEQIRVFEPTGESTRLGAAVEAVLDDLRGSVPAGIIVLSDGVNTEGPSLESAAAAARRRGVPLFLVGLGDDQPIRDVKVTDLLVDEVVFVDDVVSFELKLSASGYEGRDVRVVLRRDDSADVLAETQATLGPDGQSQTLRLNYRPSDEGEFRFLVEVGPLDDETQTDNNRLDRVVRVRKQQISVLLVQAYPNYEFRYLRNMLSRDDTIRLDTLLQSADPEHAQQDASALRVFPVRRDELFAYDVIILGDVDPRLLGDAAMRNVTDYVNQPGKGGALVFLAGPAFMPLALDGTPLAALLPVELGSVRLPDANRSINDGFTVEPTELGFVMPSMQLGDSPEESMAIWRRLPPLYWMIETPHLKAAARVLAVHPTRSDHEGRPLPVIVMQYVGAGRVLMHMTDETWRWRYRTGDALFARYWVQTIRYLSRSKLADPDRVASLSADRREYRPGEPVQLRLRFVDPRQAPADDDGVTLVVEHRGHQTQRITLHRRNTRELFEGVIERPSMGEYHVWMAVPALEGSAPAVDFTVAAPPGEFERTQMAAAELRRAADATKGRFYTFATAAKLADDLPPGRQVPVETLPPKPLWNQWPVLLVFLGLLVFEWIVRKMKGMV